LYQESFLLLFFTIRPHLNHANNQKPKIWLVQRFKPRRFENVRFFLIWPDSSAKLVLETNILALVQYLRVSTKMERITSMQQGAAAEDDCEHLFHPDTLLPTVKSSNEGWMPTMVIKQRNCFKAK